MGRAVFAAGAVFFEAIGAQAGAGTKCADQIRGQSRLIEHDYGIGDGGGVELGEKRATSVGPGDVIVPFPIGAATEHQKAVAVEARGSGNVDHVAGAAGKAGGFGDAGEIEAGALPEP